MHWNDNTEKRILERLNRPRPTAGERWRKSRLYELFSLALFVTLVMLTVIALWLVKL